MLQMEVSRYVCRWKYVCGTKIFLQICTKYTEICFQNSSRIQFLGVQKWCNANVFPDTKQKHVCCKICKLFWVKMYCNMRDLFQGLANSVKGLRKGCLIFYWVIGWCESQEKWFWPFELFSKLETTSLNIEHRLKSILPWRGWVA